MKKIILLGSSVSCVSAIEALQNTDCEITLVSQEAYLPYDRALLPEYLSRKTLLSQVLCKPKSFYEKAKVNIQLGKKIARVNFRKGVATTEEKEQFEYDTLIIADVGEYKFPDIRGVNKFGVFNVNTLTDAEQIVNRLAFSETVVIYATQISGLLAAQAIKARGKEVIVFVKVEPSETTEPILKSLEESGAVLFKDNTIVEILGDSEAKAVRLDFRKVIASDIILFDDLTPNLRFLSDSPLEIEGKIKVDEFFKTNIENVYAVDQVCQVSGQAAEQGKAVASNILGQNAPVGAPQATT